ncbi:hypothetical protein EGM51_06920 [Verrucomicrobia bacterium S94]|nr:hypothetical protein EGM51_06920 [Verrucomicrobia bacterium S94]
MKTKSTPNKYHHRNGSILITILVILFVLSSILGGVLTLSTQYFSLAVNRVDFEQALYLAEAGIERACNYIERNGIRNYRGNGTIGDGTFTYNISKDGFYEGTIEAEGEVNGKKRKIRLTGVRNATFASYSFWVDDNGRVNFATGDYFDGRVHTGTAPYFSGSPIFDGRFTSTASSYARDSGPTNSVQFNAGYEYGVDQPDMSEISFDDMHSFAQTNITSDTLLLTGETEITFADTEIVITNPGNGWKNYYYTISDEQLVYIQSGYITVTTVTTNEEESATSNYVKVGHPNGDYYRLNNGTYVKAEKDKGEYNHRGNYKGYPNGKYVYLTNGSLVKAKNGQGEFDVEMETTTTISTNVATVYSEGTLQLNGGTLDGRITIITEDDIYINNHIDYALDPLDTNACDAAIAEAAANGEDHDYDDVVNDALGLVSGSDVVVTTSAPDDLRIDASIMATGDGSGVKYGHSYNDSYDGCFVVDDFDYYAHRGNIYLLGGIIQKDRGPVGLVSGNGYSKNYTFDQRFSAYPPPYFPPLGDELTYQSWEEVVTN